MIIVSDLINAYYNIRLGNKNFRKQIFVSALNNELRHKKLGRALLRNLNEKMNRDISIHNEFLQLVGEQNFQTRFWESDLGYLWFDGNAKADKPYFDTTVKLINTGKLESLLDVGCGWGIFCNKCAQETQLATIKGIDVSEGVITNAKRKFNNPKLSFEKKDFFGVQQAYDIITIFGSIDYVLPADIEKFIQHMLQLAKKNIVIVNSLRKLPLEEAMKLSASREVKRYDVGYVHPLVHLLEQHKKTMAFTYTAEKSMDSIVVTIQK